MRCEEGKERDGEKGREKCDKEELGTGKGRGKGERTDEGEVEGKESGRVA